MASRPFRRRWLWVLPVGLVAWWWAPAPTDVEAVSASPAPFVRQNDTTVEPPRLAEGDAGIAGSTPAAHGPDAPPGPALTAAIEALEHYRAVTQYPFNSRPADEHADAMTLGGAERRLPGRTADAPTLVLTQDRLFVVGDEQVKLHIDSEPPGACALVAAHLRAPPDLPVVFRDDGSGRFSASVQPSQLPQFERDTVRIECELRCAGQPRTAFFDVKFSPVAPASFSGAYSDELENGSLRFDVTVNVQQPGHYLITGRVDDASHTGLALVQFNDELTAGEHRVPLTVFGKLVVDRAPAFPLVLRDLEGARLNEHGAPDRVFMAPQLGAQHRSRMYGLEVFSTQSWDSEQKRRYLGRLEAKVAQLRGAR